MQELAFFCGCIYVGPCLEIHKSVLGRDEKCSWMSTEKNVAVNVEDTFNFQCQQVHNNVDIFTGPFLLTFLLTYV